MPMNTPICDFVNKYNSSNFSRLHMPGHKGQPFLGCEALDLTEIKGADDLFAANGIIAQSEENASKIFGSRRTFYSTEGSSLSVKAMLYMALTGYGESSRRPYILAARNVHKTFVYGCAFLDLDVEWMYPQKFNSLCSCILTPMVVEDYLRGAKSKPIAVYLTSPDYLGNILDIEGISKVCKKYRVQLLVDNAHGAYLKFLGMHPMDLGADMCCDSGHKTLPVLTGGAYLHIGKNAPAEYDQLGRRAMEMFASTSPSYLILQSLDLCNKYLSEDYKNKLLNCVHRVEELKKELRLRGCSIGETEKLKLVFSSTGNGTEIADLLRNNMTECEFADPDNVVLMFSLENKDIDYQRVLTVFTDNPFPAPKTENQEEIHKSLKNMSIRKAVFSLYETIEVEESVGRICAAPVAFCPPAVPVVISGEVISKQNVDMLKKYGFKQIDVVKE